MHVVFDESSSFYLKNKKENGIDVIFDGLIQNKNQNDIMIKDDKKEDPLVMIKEHNNHEQEESSQSLSKAIRQPI
jgi:hypothetical protein